MLTAQTPAPSPSASPQAQAVSTAPQAGAPLRHLEYAFTSDYGGTRGGQYNGIGGDDIHSSSGVSTGAVSGGGKGTLSANVLSIATDGSLNVEVSEQLEFQPHPVGDFTCTVYGNTAVICPPGPSPSGAEWTILAYLGRQFVDAAPWDAKNHWQRKEQTTQYTLTEDFTMTSTTDPVTIHEDKKMEIHDGGFSVRKESIDITYDRSMERPNSVHDEMDSVGSGGSTHAVYDLKLVSDSFAKTGATAPANSHP